MQFESVQYYFIAMRQKGKECIVVLSTITRIHASDKMEGLRHERTVGWGGGIIQRNQHSVHVNK